MTAEAASIVGTGTKLDSGKPRMSLIDASFLFGMARVLTFGAGKYGPHNWRGGIEMDRLLDAAFRHLNAFNDGIDVDEETGESHLFHAACCLMMANKFTGHSVLDNRFKS